MNGKSRLVGALTIAGAILGLTFALYSTLDYAAHLDRGMHDVHCSFIPGAAPDKSAENACKAAMFSPYSSVMRTSYWGGIPISLFAVGAFAFYLGFGAYIALGSARVARKAFAFLAASSLAPLIASLVMFTISLTQLHSFCKLCVGIYVASLLLGAAGVMAMLVYLRWNAASPDEPRGREGGPLLPIAWLAGLGLATLLPVGLYTSALPDYRPYLTGCGELAVEKEGHGALLKIPTTRPSRQVLFFEDPLCPACRAFHERLIYEGAFDRMDVTIALFPLDNDCNWMLDRQEHAGACFLSKAVLCGEQNARSILEWAFDNQDTLRELGKTSPNELVSRVEARFGGDVVRCANGAQAKVRLNQHLHFASSNHIPVSTPQMFLGKQRICEQDTDLGLPYTLAELAPEVMQ